MCSSILRCLSTALLVVLVGCGPDVEPPPLPPLDPAPAWEQRLREVVSPEGEVDYAALRADSAALRDYVGWVARNGPETVGFRLTDDNMRLAWHLNALNALALWSVVEGRPFATEKQVFPRVRVLLDSEPVRLDRYVTHRVLATYEEPLVAAALACGARSCPPAPTSLYRKPTIERQLREQLQRWVASGRLVREEGGKLYFSPALRPWMPAFARWGHAETPCDVVRGVAPGRIVDAVQRCDWAWDAWDGGVDGRG